MDHPRLSLASTGPSPERPRIVPKRIANEPALLGSSAAMVAIRDQLRLLAPLPMPVRLEGPSGTGKGVAARLLHLWSGRAPDRWVEAPLSELVPGLAHGQLLGQRRGSFTGAADLPGAFERAHLGTLFLDEIALATPPVQRLLLRLLTDGAVRRIGEHRARRVEVRLVFATNADLEREVRQGRFREDLFYRLGSFVVRLPALRKHRRDILEIAEAALTRAARRFALPPRQLTPADHERVLAYEWPGNVRQLESAMEWYTVYGALPEMICARFATDWSRLKEVMARHDGNAEKAAQELGVTRQAVHYQLKKAASGDHERQSDGAVF